MKRGYDVHLIFNHHDQKVVEVIDERLRQRGLLPWLWDRDAPAEWEEAEIASIGSTPASAVFLGPAGWGPTHLRFARLAQDLGRPIIPVVLPGWRSGDLPQLNEPFRRRRVEFRSADDAEALSELASRIVESAYERPDDVPTAPKAERGRRLMVYVPARSQTVESWSSLRQYLEKEPQLQGCAWYGHSYTASAWSRESLEDYALELETRISAEVLSARVDDPALPITGITLMGHSFGGVLARMAYLISAGRYKEIKIQGSEWWSLVDRIVLFAAPNRGIEIKRIPRRERLAVHWPFGRAGRLTRDQLKGSEAITNLRIRWIRFFAELEPGRRPTVVQFLGKGDRLVSRDDSLDIEQFSDAWQCDVPGATHADVHVVPEGETRRYNILRQGILEAKPTDLSAEEPGSPRKNPVVIVVHGIRATNETWAAQVRDLIRAQAPNAVAVAPTYRYFPMLDFAIPWLRAKKIRWLQDQYSELLARYPRARFCFLGHSNGTYMLGHSLARVPAMAFDRVTLVGSVLPRDYDWRKLFTHQVGKVTNHRAARDMPVAILCNLLRALGMKDVGTAGFDGFDQAAEEIEEIYYYDGGHSEGLRRENLPRLVDDVLSGKSDFPLARRDTQPGKFLSRLSGSTIFGFAVAGALAAMLGLATWLLFWWLKAVLPWPPIHVGLLASAAVLVVFYLFSRYF